MNAAGRPWTRSSTGILAGVCKGLAQRFDLDVLIVRLGLVLAVLFFGTGGLAYIIAALSLPREDKLENAYESRILGVCARFATRFDLDVGLTRMGFLTLLLFSCGTMIAVYLILYFILPSREECKKNKFRAE